MLVGVAGLLALVVKAPERLSGPAAVRGHRILGVSRPAVRALDVTLDERRFAAHRRADGWEIDGHPAPPRVADALEDLVDTLARLRAVDVFRSRDPSTYGLDRPRATIEVTANRRRRRLVLGAMNAAGSAFYGMREGDPRVLQVGALIVSEIERVFYTRDGPPPG
jgi:hypothetical protein